VRNRFIAEHRPKRGPTGVIGSLHDTEGEFLVAMLGNIHIADDDFIELPHEVRRLLVEVMLAPVGDLGVDRPGAALVAGALRPCR
jgi:hypothetical protein